jgi:raffinose/stachyose/melibiose transport system permease protein
MTATTRLRRTIGTIALTVLSVLYLVPVALMLMNSFKSRLFIRAQTVFDPPNSESFVGLDNYTQGVAKVNFWSALGYSLTITVVSVAVIVVCCSMTAWYIARVKNKFTSILYYLFVFSMVVPFQMVMYTMVQVTNRTHLDNPIGIAVIYLGFGAGLSVFIFVGFMRSVPVSLEEAAMMDGANAWQVFFKVIFPVVRPTAITVAILNTMWVWNDYLLPQMTIGTKYHTIPVAIQQAMTGGYGDVDMGGMMAVLVIAITPIIVFYLILQKHIIKGVVAGAVKG